MMGMMGNNPYAMGTMPPGAAGMMRGMGLGGGMGGQGGPMNAMRQPEVGGMMQAAQQQQGGGQRMPAPDLNQMAQMLRGVQQEGRGLEQSATANPERFAGPMPDGGNFLDATMRRAQSMQGNPFMGAMQNRFGF